MNFNPLSINDIDTIDNSTLAIGASLANLVNISRTGILTNVKGSLLGDTTIEATTALRVNGHNLRIDDLSDVDTTTIPPTLNNFLKWNSTNWVPVDLLGSTQELSAITNVATSSTTYVVIPSPNLSMSLVAGTYLIIFSGDGRRNATDVEHRYAIYNGGVQIANSVRSMTSANSGRRTALCTQALITLGTTTTVEVQYSVSVGTGSFRIDGRSMIAVRLS